MHSPAELRVLICKCTPCVYPAKILTIVSGGTICIEARAQEREREGEHKLVMSCSSNVVKGIKKKHKRGQEKDRQKKEVR